ncbi:dipeptide epimerase [Chondrinema litorale]|uniref:dipeptide epimerase n=1 Tax=Chondrinema litorale TaxID=2994555 RepID=UPI002542AF66|nr:dipeptide epimerase [Chondrinema litorale]UZR93665.1 dipeptide epimerase [Chondrinema litorale]
MQLKIKKQTLQLKQTFTISRGSRTSVDNAIVLLSFNGFTGLGEATANPYYNITTDLIEQDLLALESFLADYQFINPEKLWQDVFPLLQANPFALCALDEAAHDLYGKINNQPLYKLWNLDYSKAPLSNYTLGIDKIPEMINKIKEMPWPVYKIKLGTAHDLEIVKALRKETDAILRVDANGGWTAEQCISFSKEFKNLGVEFIEQPLPAEEHEAMKEAFKYSELPLVADESCIVESDVPKCKGLFHGVNIKLMKCGGITPARRMVKAARSLGMKVMVGCMTESSVGISSIAHIAPELDYVDMDGALLIKNDPASGIALDYGKIVYNELPGNGAALTADPIIN